MPEKNLADQYNKIATKWYKQRTKQKVMNELIEMPTVLSLLTGIRNKKILDLGCGPGIYAKILKSRGAKVWGIDIAEKEIEIAKKHAKGVDFMIGSAYDLPYKAKFFDIVVSSLVVDHFERLDRAFSEARRVLKKGGIFIFSIYDPVISASRRVKGKPRNYRIIEDYFNESEKYKTWFPKTKNEAKMSYLHRTHQTWIRTIIRNGFAVDDYIETKRPANRPKGATKKHYDFYRFTLDMPHVSVFKVRAV